MLKVPNGEKVKVFVDATISNSQDPNLPHEAYVAYVVEGREDMRGMKPIEATQTDDAEMQAILYAIDELHDKLNEFVIFSDHESVVSEVNKNLEVDSRLEQIRSRLRSNKNIKVDLFRTNPADRYLREQLLRHKPISP
jgi:ribonuclease HI